ncbi:MAG TPA: response regulator [bacterium]|nr:response regulator [bacterium]
MNKKNILVVEDEKSLLDAISTKLEKNEFTVSRARTYEEAMSALKKNKNIGVIWLDHYLMGKKDGLDIITECKKDNSTYSEIPIFVVSNTASSDKIEKYLELGAVKYYVKAEKRLEDIIKDINKYFDNSI